jgi:hypothetical protein
MLRLKASIRLKNSSLAPFFSSFASPSDCSEPRYSESVALNFALRRFEQRLARALPVVLMVAVFLRRNDERRLHAGHGVVASGDALDGRDHLVHFLLGEIFTPCLRGLERRAHVFRHREILVEFLGEVRGVLGLEGVLQAHVENPRLVQLQHGVVVR